MALVIRSPNFWQGRRYGPPIAVVIHTMDGSIQGADAWFATPASQVSAHYGVGLDGEFHRYVRREDTAWANGLLEPGNSWPGPLGINPNWLTVSIETEDMGESDRPVSNAQYDMVRTLVRTMSSFYPSIAWLIGHDTISPQTRPNCPGSRWRESGELEQLATDTELTLV